MDARGGRREGSGRPTGRKNNTTISREKLLADACKRMANRVTFMSPLEIIIELQREAIAVGDVQTVLTAGQMVLPYTAPRLAPVTAIDANAPTTDEIAADDDPEMADEPRYGELQN